MTIEIHKPELEQRMQETIRSGQFHDMDELLMTALDALREKEGAKAAQSAPSGQKPRKRLIDVLTSPPFAGSELNIQRQKDYPRPIAL